MDNTTLSGQYFHLAGVTTSVDEYHIRHTTYKIFLKLQPLSSAPPLNFNTVYTRNAGNPTPLHCTRRSLNLPSKGWKVSGLNELPSHFSFYFELENDQKKQRIETCTLFVKLAAATGKEKATLFKYALNVECACGGGNSKAEQEMEKEKEAIQEKETVYRDKYPECTKVDMVDFYQRSPLQLGRHTHDCQVFGWRQEYFLTITEFDFSEATMMPYEAQRLLAKRSFEKEVRESQSVYFTEIQKPFDVTIICKDGLEIDVHAYILSARNHVFRKILSGISPKISGRGSSFRKLAREAFTLGKGDRNKKSKTVTIDESEISSGAMEVILHFLYFGELHNNWKTELLGVLHGARKYGLKQLLEFVNVLLITLCRKKNALSLLRLAERYSLKGAESAIRDYIFTNLGGVLQATVKITSV